jgi:hypothetical protein
MKKALLVSVVCGLSLFLGACGSTSGAGGTLPSTTTTMPPPTTATTEAGLPAHTTLQSFEKAVASQLSMAGGDGFHVSGLSNVTCVMGAAWRPGQKFFCFAYDSAGNEIGAAHGVVLSTSGDKQYKLTWQPSS